jgi:hypothetical protein
MNQYKETGRMPVQQEETFKGLNAQALSSHDGLCCLVRSAERRDTIPGLGCDVKAHKKTIEQIKKVTNP